MSNDGNIRMVSTTNGFEITTKDFVGKALGKTCKVETIRDSTGNGVIDTFTCADQHGNSNAYFSAEVVQSLKQASQPFDRTVSNPGQPDAIFHSSPLTSNQLDQAKKVAIRAKDLLESAKSKLSEALKSEKVSLNSELSDPRVGKVVCLVLSRADSSLIATLHFEGGSDPGALAGTVITEEDGVALRFSLDNNLINGALESCMSPEPVEPLPPRDDEVTGT